MQDLRPYEAAVVLRADLSEEQIDAYLARLVGIIRQQGGEPGEPDKWGRRRLAYEIAHQRDGYYAIVPFRAPPAAPEEVRRVLRLSEEVLRFLVVHPPKPSKANAGRSASGHVEPSTANREPGEPSDGEVTSPSLHGSLPSSHDLHEPAAAGVVGAGDDATATTQPVGAGQREIPD